LYGRAAGLTAVSLWCFCPNILANAQMITSDVGAAAFAVTSAYAFWHWLKGPDWGGALIAGTALGIAQLTKTTLVVFFVLWPSIWFVWRYGSRSEPSARLRLVKQGAQLIAILGLSVYVINLGYGFVGSGERLGDLPFISRFLTAESGPSGDGLRVNRFAGTWLGALRVPVPRDYALGIDRQRFDFERGYWSYLAGEWRFGGWWYYYLYSLGIKVPLGTWGLGLSALAVTFLARGYPRVSRDEILLLMPAVAVLSLVSSQTGFSHHMRYVLPIFPFAFIWISKAGPLAHRSRVSASLTSAALAWSFASSLWIYPHSLSYFNEAVGGPMGGHAHLLNSNIDWGQDLLYLKRWIDGHPEAKRIALAYSLPGPLLDPKDLGLEYTLPPSGPQSTPGDWPIVTWATGPLPGWYALCVNRIRDWDNQYAYFLRFKPVATAGYSIYIYHFTLGDANRVRQELRLPELTIAGKEGGE
jgi:4-amino-4-deoxy-L-arabinose transferase-like glycosyltransferase